MENSGLHENLRIWYDISICPKISDLMAGLCWIRQHSQSQLLHKRSCFQVFTTSQKISVFINLHSNPTMLWDAINSGSSTVMCHEVLSRRLLWKFEGQSIPAFVKNKVLHAGVKSWCRKLDWHRLSDITLRVMGFWRETERQSETVRERVDKEHHACHRV